MYICICHISDKLIYHYIIHVTKLTELTLKTYAILTIFVKHEIMDCVQYCISVNKTMLKSVLERHPIYKSYNIGHY